MAQKQKILIVEDDDFLRTLAYNKLISNNFDVTAVSDGKAGLDSILQNSYDVVILDLMLPTVDGFGIINSLKEQDLLKKQRIIVFSNLGTEEDISKVVKSGIKNYMIKSSFTLDELVSKINEIISQPI